MTQPQSIHEVSSEQEFLYDVIHGLSQPQKMLPSKYFYDKKGSALFTEICELEEYYVTRTELALLREQVNSVAQCLGDNVHIIEPGSGAGEKISLLLNALKNPAQVTLLDISEEILEDSVMRLRARFDTLNVHAVAGDFTRLNGVRIPHLAAANRKAIYFPGSTIGNFSPVDANKILSSFHRLVGPEGGLLIGVDQVKPVNILERAYNDEKGITAAFNLNLLARINKQLNGSFDLSKFRHQAIFNTEQSRIEMHLHSTGSQTVCIGGHSFCFNKGESIHTENSYKYTPESFIDLATAAGWRSVGKWFDAKKWFAIHYFEANYDTPFR